VSIFVFDVSAKEFRVNDRHVVRFRFLNGSFKVV